MIIKDVYSFSSEAIAKAMENIFEISRLGAYLGKNYIILLDALSICTSATTEDGPSLDLDKKKRMPFDTAEGIAKS